MVPHRLLVQPVGAPSHECLHAPQLPGSEVVSISHPFDVAPSQLAKPAEHDAMPHTPLVQLVLAFVSVHPPQVLPLAPQLVADWLPNASQVFPLQQPLGHDEALQTHAPALHV
jgi:hypothetical protein